MDKRGMGIEEFEMPSPIHTSPSRLIESTAHGEIIEQSN